MCLRFFSQTGETVLKSNRKALMAIVGRPNVGKSTLFNRLIRKSKSLITKIAGTTRDRRYGVFYWNKFPVLVVDTGGILGEEGELNESINEQGILAMEEADVILLITSLVDGLCDDDKLLARMLRRTKKPVVVGLNKCDHEKLDALEMQKVFERLGLGVPILLSASHGRGIDTLLDKVTDHVKSLGFPEVDEETLEQDEKISDSVDTRLAIVGVPNVGKSSLLNQIIGAPRAVVSDIPGTTTDPIDCEFVWNNQHRITIIDTAGIRKKKSQEGDIEKLSSLWSLKVIENSHIALVVLDAQKGPQLQDIKISGYVMDNFKSCVVIVNKWDTVLDRSSSAMNKYEQFIRDTLKFWDNVPIIFTSATTGFNVNKIMDVVVKVIEERKVKISTNKLFQIVEQAMITRPPPKKAGKKLKFKFITQANMYGSPTFVFFVNYPDIAEGYMKYLEGVIRSYYPYTGTPIRLLVRKNESKKDK